MWIESRETMAVEGFMVDARVQRSAPDEVHTVTVVERPSIEGSSNQWLWTVETLYGQLVAEGSAASEDEAKAGALAAAKVDGGANDPEAFEQALQSTAADYDYSDHEYDHETPPHWDAYYHGGGEVWEGLMYALDGETVMIRRVWTDREYEGVEGEEFIFEVAKYLGENQWEDHRLVRHHVDEIPSLRMAKSTTRAQMHEEFTQGVMERYEALGEANDPGRTSIREGRYVIAGRETTLTRATKDAALRLAYRFEQAGMGPVTVTTPGGKVIYKTGDDYRTAAVAAEDYPVLAEVLEERPPLEHNAGRFPGDGEDETDIAPLGAADLATPGPDEQGMDSFLSSMVEDCVATIHGFVTGQHDDADRAFSAYDLLTTDERLSTVERGAKAIHMYETVTR